MGVLQMEVVGIVLGTIISVGTVLGILWKVWSPHLEKFVIKLFEDRYDSALSKLEERTMMLEAKVTTLEALKTKDYHRLEKLAEQNKAILSALFALLKNASDAHPTDMLIKAEEALQEHLIHS